MHAAIKAIIDHVLKVEGSAYTNRPSDRGGPTRFGITLSTLRAYRGANTNASHVQNLTELEARQIYYTQYVLKPGFDKVMSLSPELGAKMVDAGVNAGPGRASRWLQHALNAFNRSNRSVPDYPDVVEDGAIGPATINALAQLLRFRGKVPGATALLRAVNAQQGAHYLNLAAKAKSQEEFAFGWFINRVS